MGNRNKTNTSSDFGYGYLVEIEYKDEKGKSLGRSLHGKFDTKEEAAKWLKERLKHDYKDVSHGTVIIVNHVE